LNSKFSILLITAKPVNPTTINCDVLFSKLANKERSFLTLFYQSLIYFIYIYSEEGDCSLMHETESEV